MKKRELSPGELKKVVELRQIGATWTEIEQETKVERRAAKRAYDEWERDTKAREQEASRFRVAAEAFHQHLNDLIRLAELLTDGLHVPAAIQGFVGADEALDQLWTRNIEGQPQSSSVSRITCERRAWRNKMLLQSLQDHTQEKVRWKALEEWRRSRDSAVHLVRELRLRSVASVQENLNRCPGLENTIKIDVGSDDIVAKLADGLVQNIWRGILTGTLEQLHVNQALIREGELWLEFDERDSQTRFYLSNLELATEVHSMCCRTVADLWEETQTDLVSRLAHDVSQMRSTCTELQMSLDELVLRPVILHTRCDLCPA